MTEAESFNTSLPLPPPLLSLLTSPLPGHLYYANLLFYFTRGSLGMGAVIQNPSPPPFIDSHSRELVATAITLPKDYGPG